MSQSIAVVTKQCALRMRNDADLNATYFFRDRSLVEDDDNFAQIIAYTILVCKDGLVGYYRGKSGSENRLHGKKSVGFGGHTEIQDCAGKNNICELIKRNAERELSEELRISDGVVFEYPDPPIIIFEDASPNIVDRCHIGIVTFAKTKLSLEEISSNEDCISDLFIVDFKNLNIDEYESWSKIAIKHYLAMILNTNFVSKKN